MIVHFVAEKRSFQISQGHCAIKKDGVRGVLMKSDFKILGGQKLLSQSVYDGNTAIDCQTCAASHGADMQGLWPNARTQRFCAVNESSGIAD